MPKTQEAQDMKAMRHEILDHEHVRLETSEASKGWGAQEHLGHEAQVAQEQARHKTR